jgi:hypothetical protein
MQAFMFSTWVTNTKKNITCKFLWRGNTDKFSWGGGGYTLPLEQSTLSPTNTSFFHARHSQAETNNGCRDHKRRPRPNYKPQIIYNVKDDRQLQNVSCAPRRSKNQRTTYSLPAQRQKVSRMKSWAEPHRLATT